MSTEVLTLFDMFLLRLAIFACVFRKEFHFPLQLLLTVLYWITHKDYCYDYMKLLRLYIFTRFVRKCL